MIILSALHIYPVKGLKGIELTQARATDRGLEHDRRFMVVDDEGNFLSQREQPGMATIWTEIEGERLTLAAPDMGEVGVPVTPDARPTLRVRVWRSVVDAAPVSAAADAWLSEYLGLACRLVYMPDSTRRHSNPDYAGPERLVGFADGYAYLMVGEASLLDLNRRLADQGGKMLPMNRFRPNVVVSGAPPYAEDGWSEVRIGDAILGGAKPCGRCQVTTTDQATGEVVGPEPLATLSTYRDSPEFGVMFGMNYVTLQGGTLRVGDRVEATACRSSP
jgi:uncharacterized protein